MAERALCEIQFPYLSKYNRHLESAHHLRYAASVQQSTATASLVCIFVCGTFYTSCISECTSKMPKIALSLEPKVWEHPPWESLNQVPHLHSNQINTFRIAFPPVHCCTCYTCRWFHMSVRKDLCRFLQIPAFASMNHHQIASGHPSSIDIESTDFEDNLETGTMYNM